MYFKNLGEGEVEEEDGFSVNSFTYWYLCECGKMQNHQLLLHNILQLHSLTGEIMIKYHAS